MWITESLGFSGVKNPSVCSAQTEHRSSKSDPFWHRWIYCTYNTQYPGNQVLQRTVTAKLSQSFIDFWMSDKQVNPT